LANTGRWCNFVGDSRSTAADGANSVSLLLLGNCAAGSVNLGPESGGGTGTAVTDPPMSNGTFLTVAPPH